MERKRVRTCIYEWWVLGPEGEEKGKGGIRGRGEGG